MVSKQKLQLLEGSRKKIFAWLGLWDKQILQTRDP